ncbi:MAG: SDR family oxidoreductase [Acidimicrobiia bacterium]|nr:SDR family oxidoreductase [Acidimicrobiia bacterium]
MTEGPTRGRVLVTGATGYVGGRLVPQLLDAGYQVRCLARTPSKVAGFPWSGDVDVVAGDVTDAASVRTALTGCAAAYYLVHSMGGEGAFAERDRAAAATFRDAAAGVDGLRQVIYLGALGDDRDPNLSPHLRSRQEVGRVLAEGSVPVTELRAAVIIGSGSASFEMLRHLVERLPAMLTPRWVRTRCQPVAIRDVLYWLVVAADEPKARGRVLEIGGADVVTYGEMMRVYAEVAHLRRRVVVPVPLLTPRLSSLWIGLVTPLPPSLGRPLVEGLSSEVIVRDRPAADVLPHTPLSFRDAVERAVRRVEHLEVATTWAGADLTSGPADPLPTDPDWAGGTLLSDEKETAAAAPATADDLFAVVEGIGGVHGWYVTPALWWLRGATDRAVGGVGLRRGRRHPDQLRVGDALDFWRVEAYEPPRLLRLRAEMRLPGRAWLEWQIEPLPSGGARLCQRALYHPRGLWGRAYWWCLLPFHALIFGRLAHAIATRAEERGVGRGPTALSVTPRL